MTKDPAARDPSTPASPTRSDVVPAIEKAELALRRSEERFRSLIESAPESISVQAEGRFVYANPATARFLGYELGELDGRLITDVVHPDDLVAAVARGRRMIVSGESEPAALHRFVRKDGSVVVAETVPLVMDYDGRRSLIVFARDVSDRVRMEAQLRHADRLVSIGTLAAGVAHEINNPLAYVVSNLAMAAETLPDLARDLAARGDTVSSMRVEETVRVLSDALEGADRVRTIVRDLKTLSRPEDPQITRVDVTAALESALHMARNEIRHRARVVRNYAGDPAPIVMGNASRLGQVFLNLVANAAHAIPVGDAEGNEIRVGVHVIDGQVEVTVSDSGEGIAPENLARVFDPFFTTRSPGEGTGLGLSICHGIVHALGGDIKVESEQGRGTTFRVTIPAAVPRASITPPRAGAAMVPGVVVPVGKRRVLIVDDEPAIGRALSRLLVRDGHEVVTSTSGREALDRLAAGEQFDLVMCDLMMPELTGVELYEQVLATKPEVAERFVFMTGGAFTARAREFLATVPNPTVEKPFDAAQVRALISSR